MIIRRIAKILLPIGLAGAGATGIWYLHEGGSNYAPSSIYIAFSSWVFVVLTALTMLAVTRPRSRT